MCKLRFIPTPSIRFRLFSSRFEMDRYTAKYTYFIVYKQFIHFACYPECKSGMMGIFNEITAKKVRII